MINSKYDPNNYLKHLAVPVISDNQKINQLFGSYLLRVRWWHDNPKMSPQSDLIGTLRVHMDTPFGAVEPRDYQFKISSHKQIYVQFLTIPIPEFEYKIEVIHPVGLTRSKIELWEYIPPETFTTIKMQVHQPTPNQDNSAIIAAIQAGTAAEIAADQLSDSRVMQDETTKQFASYLAIEATQRIQDVNIRCRSAIVSTSVPEVRYRFYSEEPFNFQDETYIVELFGANAQFTREFPECQTALWMCCDTDAPGAANNPNHVTVSWTQATGVRVVVPTFGPVRDASGNPI